MEDVESVYRPPYRKTVTRKGSILRVLIVTMLRQESAFLVTTKTIAATVTPESGLALEDILDDSNACGNEAKWSPDNGEKHIKAMGYILVQ